MKHPLNDLPNLLHRSVESAVDNRLQAQSISHAHMSRPTRKNSLNVDPSRESRKLRNLIGVQLQTSSLPANMTVDEAMKFFCSYHSVPPRYDLLDRMGLEEKRRNQYHELSTGQQRRLSLALAVAHRPPVVILDEPTAGLDVASRTELHTLMQELKNDNIAILLATHDMAEAEKMTDRLAILLKGNIVAAGSPTELTATGSGFTKVSIRTEDSLLHKNGAAFPCVSTARASASAWAGRRTAAPASAS